MNFVAMVGRLTKDPDINYSQGGNTFARFSIAVNRRFKTEGQPDADFLNCISFGKTAEFIEKYFHKGDPIALTGRIQTGSYTNKEGVKIYTTDVMCENVEFVPRSSADAPAPAANAAKPSDVGDGFMDVADDSEDGLPFA